MPEWIDSPLFGILLSVLAFKAGLWVNRKLKSPLANPLLLAVSLIILFLKITGIPYEAFDAGGRVISLLLPPATAVLAASIYREIEILKKNFLPVVLGCLAGSLTSIFSVIGLCKLFGLNEALTLSLIPKSVTTPIAIEISRTAGGIPAVTVAAVLVTGISGAVFAPVLLKLFRVKNPVAAGVALGTTSHAVGTSRALELGRVQGAMSGVAIGISGLLTVLISLFL